MFYDYHQNNSGGSFREPAINVIIQANSAREADSRAREIGLYFEGVEDDIDCPCCGDRWYPKDWGYEDEGTEFPTLYGVLVEEKLKNVADIYKNDIPFIKIYYLDGNIEVLEAQ